jgi:alpha-glucosidase
MGAYVPVQATEVVLAYERRHEDRRLLVALNMSNEHEALPIAPGAAVLLSTYLDRAGQNVTMPLRLRPNEGVILARG